MDANVQARVGFGQPQSCAYAPAEQSGCGKVCSSAFRSVTDLFGASASFACFVNELALYVPLVFLLHVSRAWVSLPSKSFESMDLCCFNVNEIYYLQDKCMQCSYNHTWDVAFLRPIKAQTALAKRPFLLTLM